MSASSRITDRLSRAHPAVLNGYAVTLAFMTYFCMYAFRKPFAAGQYESLYFAGTRIELKTAFVVSQIMGYALSKFLGIKYCSEVSRWRRAGMLVTLILAAELALVLFAVVPEGWKVVAIFFNGLPLGMVWGLVVRYLEGRRTSEILLAGLCTSYIVSSGVVKNVGLALMAGDGPFGIEALRLSGPVSEFWMPAAVGLMFLPIFLVSVWLLDRLPDPSALDVAARTERISMDRGKRLDFLRRYAPGLLLLAASYFFLTAFRDFRDNYLVDVLEELGYGYAEHKNTVTVMESGVAASVMAVMAALYFIKDNRRGLLALFCIIIAGFVILGGSTALWSAGAISGVWWIALLGLGTFLAYVPYNAMLFDRLIASTRVASTAVFAIYVADACGYTGSIFVQLYKDLGNAADARYEFLARFAYFLSAFGTAALVGSCWYFWNWTSREASVGVAGDMAAHAPTVPPATSDPAMM